MSVAVAPDSLPIPASHLDLFKRPICGVLTTMAPDGRPESSLVWVDIDGGYAAVNTTLERRKGRNMRGRPEGQPARGRSGRHGPLHPGPRRRGAVHLWRARPPRPADASLHAPRHYYGGIYPLARREHETRVIVRIHARRITLDAIHA